MKRLLLTVVLFLAFAAPAVAANTAAATWERCKEQTIVAKTRQAARERRSVSDYFGATGAGARSLVQDACGLKPSLTKLLATERAVLEESCKEDGDLSSLSNAVLSWFRPYGEESPHWRLAVEECHRISLATALPTSTYAQWLEVCASFGASAEKIVHARDNGIPLTTVLMALSQQKTPFLHPLIMEIYSKSYWDAAYARRQTETRCVAKIPNH